MSTYELIHEYATEAGEALASGNTERARRLLMEHAALRDSALTTAELLAGASAR